jgi:hypothetical protein
MASLPPFDAAPLALTNSDELTVPAVKLMLRRRFYGRPWRPDYEVRTRRSAAIVAMHALAGAGATELNNFETTHFDPEGKTVVLRFLDAWRLVPVMPALEFVLADWIGSRPDGPSKSMFVDDDGEALAPQTIDVGLRRIGGRLGARHALPAMMFDFFRARIARSSNAEAYHYLLGLQPNVVKYSSATTPDIHELMEAVDPIGDDLGFLTDDAVAADLAAGYGNGFPLTLDDLTEGGAWRAWALDRKHPLAARLARERDDRPEDPETRAAHDARVMEENLPEMEPLIRESVLSTYQAARMYGMSNEEFGLARAEALAAQGLSHRGKGPDDRRPMTAEEKVRIARIAAEVWPDDPAEIMPFRLDLLSGEFGFVRKLLRDRKLYDMHVPDLFRVSVDQIKELKAAADEGRLDRLLADPPRTWWTVPYDFRPPMTDEQRARLARIAAEPWPEDPADQLPRSIDLMRRDFAFVRGLILTRRLNREEARDLFKATFGQINVLMDAADEGRLEQVLADPTGRVWQRSGMCAPITAEQRARVERIAAEPWPAARSQWPEFRIALLRREFPFVRGLTKVRLLSDVQVMELFKASERQMRTLRAVADDALKQTLESGLVGRRWKVQNPKSRPLEFTWRPARHLRPHRAVAPKS